MLRAVGVLLAGALLVAGMHSAAVRGLADAHYTSARLTLATGTMPGGALRQDSLAGAVAAVRQALILEGSNPLYVEQAARLQELQSLARQPRDREVREGLKLSLAQYREAAIMRPGSPYVWASIAMLKARLDDMDFEFYGALERAARLGPWEPQVQIALADVGLAAWPWLARPGKDIVLAALERGLKRQDRELSRIAVIHRTRPLVCAEARDGMARLAAWCVRK